jgi:hypothetical protein
MMSRACLCVAILSGLAGCQGNDGVHSCGTPLAPIKSMEGWERPELTPIVDYHLSSEGDVLLGAVKVGDGELSQRLQAAADFVPTPIAILSVDKQVSCTRANEVRSIMAKSALCKTGQCFEGNLHSQ